MSEIIKFGENLASKSQQTLMEISCKRVYGLRDDLTDPITLILKALQDLRASGMEGALLAAIINALIIDEFATTQTDRAAMMELIQLLTCYLYGDFSKELPDEQPSSDD